MRRFTQLTAFILQGLLDPLVLSSILSYQTYGHDFLLFFQTQPSRNLSSINIQLDREPKYSGSSSKVYTLLPKNT